MKKPISVRSQDSTMYHVALVRTPTTAKTPTLERAPSLHASLAATNGRVAAAAAPTVIAALPALSPTSTTAGTITTLADPAGVGWEDALGAEDKTSASNTGIHPSSGPSMI